MSQATPDSPRGGPGGTTSSTKRGGPLAYPSAADIVARLRAAAARLPRETPPANYPSFLVERHDAGDSRGDR